MTHAELIKQIADGSAVPQKDVKRVIEELTKTVISALRAEDDVTLPGVGKLIVVHRAARTGMNPSNGQPVTIAAKRAVKIKQAKEMTRALAA